MKQSKTRRWLGGLIFQRIMVILLILMQLATLIYFISSGSRHYRWIQIALNLFSLLIVLSIITKNENGAYKLTWSVAILVFPVFGGLLYLLFHIESGTKKFRNRLSETEDESKKYFLRPGNSLPYVLNEKLNEENIRLMKYLHNFAGFPVFSHSESKYFKIGEEFFEALIEALSKAEKYIFMEYFILSEGKMWDTIFGILKEKAAAGVDVRLIYDDVGCFLQLPKNFSKELAKFNIKATVFNALHPILTTKQNNRDHRKITVIDGKTAFTGGINLADEYINQIVKYGHWKDTGVQINGVAAWSFVVMFLQMWSYCMREKIDYRSFYPWSSDTPCTSNSTGLIQPYADSPADKENVGEHVYLEIISNAKNYLYITTPYLIIDDTMISELKLAAKSGVDVKIITPHIWDKKFVHFTTQSYYRELIKGGVKIYEYTPGFVHSKTFVSDDSVATVGTTNLDFRSLYLHFECGTVIYNNESVLDVKKDFVATLEKCQEITLEQCNKNPLTRLFQNIFRLFAPLM